MNTKLKICGMKDAQNIREVLSVKPDYLGFIFYKPSKRYVDNLSPQFVKQLKGVKKVGVFVDEQPDVMKTVIDAYGLDAVQLHGHESPAVAETIKTLGVIVIKAFGIAAGFDWEQLAAYEKVVDYYLFDTKTVAHGGSGESFDWDLLKQYKGQLPYFLSGGLNPQNIAIANELDDTRLFALDVNSKFELQSGWKDVKLLQAVFG